MITAASFRERLADGEPAYGTFLNLGSALSAEICASAGFDWVLVDLEHGASDEAGLIPLMHALSSTPALATVRVESHERARIGHALDRGAQGIMAPRVDTAAMAEQVVLGSRFAPCGTRGVATMTRAADFGARTADLVSGRLGDPLVIIQIESPQALENVDEIAATDGVDVLFVGPSDLSHAMGIFGQTRDPGFVEALGNVSKAATSNGKTAGILASDFDSAARYLELGYRFIGLGGDGGFVASGARTTVRGLRELISSGGTP